jgi:hypothetical protein
MGKRKPRPERFLAWAFFLERVTRIELALSAWEADVLPLNYTRNGAPLYHEPGPPCATEPTGITYSHSYESMITSLADHL